MDMYRDSYALAVIVGGKIQQEDGNTVVLPFETEYTLRLKNKQRKRAVADVHIDGKPAAIGIVIAANSHVDLERFIINNNLNEGPRFKLVRRVDARVDQPGEAENGIVEVRFYPEKDQPKVETVVHHDYVHHDCHHGHRHCRRCCKDWFCGVCRPQPFLYGGSLGGTARGSSASGFYPSSDDSLTGQALDAEDQKPASVSNALMGMAMNSVGTSVNVPTANLTSAILRAQSEDAATVQGSQSTQRFTTIFIDVDRDKPTTLQLRLRGVVHVLDQCPCGFKRSNEKYCPRCGTALAVGVAA